MFRKKRTLRLSDAGAHEFVEAMGKRIGQATDDKIRRCVAPLEEQMRLLRRDLDAMRQKAEQKSPAGGGAMERAYCALEHALICLHTGQPLFFPFEEMQEYNDVYRRELICGLILALDLLRQSGVSAEQTALVEKIHRAYTSA